MFLLVKKAMGHVVGAVAYLVAIVIQGAVRGTVHSSYFTEQEKKIATESSTGFTGNIQRNVHCLVNVRF